MNKECWAAVVGYEDVYEVSGAGRVRRVGRRRGTKGIGRILTPQVDETGRCSVKLNNRGRRWHRIHRLVLLAFVGAPTGAEMECRHLNGDPGDNRLANLAWGTASENQADRLTHGTSNRGERNPAARLTPADARAALVAVKAGRMVTEVARELGVSRQCVSGIVSGRLWAHATRDLRLGSPGSRHADAPAVVGSARLHDAQPAARTAR